MPDTGGKVVGHIVTSPKQDAKRRFPSAPIDLATQILEDHQNSILVVYDHEANDGRGTRMGWWLQENGIWSNDDGPWVNCIAQILDEQLRRCANQFAGQTTVLKEVGNAINALRKRASGNLAGEVRASISQACHLGDYEGVTWCKAEQLDANLGYIGCSNGVVSLARAKLLDAKAGRKKLITKSTGIDFDPAATDQDVDNLFRHLSPELRNWWGMNLGVMLWGDPGRRFFFLVGPPKGGKTTMADALESALGTEYVSRPSDTAFGKPGQVGSASPEMEAFTQPRRIAIMDEINKPGYGIAPALLKRLSGGGGGITFRKLHQGEQTRRVTGTMLFISNPMSVPKIRANDSAIRERLRQLIYPAVPNPDPNIKERIKDAKFRRAFLAWLVNQASTQVKGQWPTADPQEVVQATLDRVDEDIGDIGRFARRLVEAPGERLSVKEVWHEWCLYNEANLDVKEAGGIKQGFMSRILRRHVDQLPATKTVKVDNKPVRGWDGWKLLDADQAEADSDLPGMPF